MVVVVSILPALAVRPRPVYDTFSYMADPSISSGRLPLVPTLYWLAGHDVRVAAAVQAVVGAVCWSALLWELAHLQGWLTRYLSMASVTCLACSTYVVGWYAAGLSESLAISLLVLVFVFLARWARTGSSLWPAVAAASGSALARSTSAYVLVPAGVVLCAWALARCRRHVPKAAVLLAAALAGAWMSGRGQLWQQPFLHSMSDRILPNAGFTRWFARRGMPTSRALSHLAGRYTPDVDAAYHRAAALAGFRTWMVRSGRTTFVVFAVTHPWWALRGAFGGHEELSAAVIGYFGGGVHRPWYPSVVADLLLTRRQDTLLLLGAADAVAVGSAMRLRTRPRGMTAWVGMCAIGWLTLVIDWVGDSWEVGRHSVEGTLTVALAGILLLATCRQPSVSLDQGGGGRHTSQLLRVAHQPDRRHRPAGDVEGDRRILLAGQPAQPVAGRAVDADRLEAAAGREAFGDVDQEAADAPGADDRPARRVALRTPVSHQDHVG